MAIKTTKANMEEGLKLGLYKDKKAKETPTVVTAKRIEDLPKATPVRQAPVQRVANREATRVKLTHASPRYKKK